MQEIPVSFVGHLQVFSAKSAKMLEHTFLVAYLDDVVLINDSAQYLHRLIGDGQTVVGFL